jgi:hypothetical protein
MKLIRFWFEFDNIHSYGVTAWNYDDAINILKEKVFSNTPFPVIKHVIENVDVSALDKGHVLPNMAIPTIRSIWFPLGYN